MTPHQVLLTTAGPLEIAAAKVNLGVTKLWFYDDEDHLLAVFRWEQVIGLQVVGSAKEQAFTHDLLHAKKTQADELAERERKNGMFLTTAELLREKLQELSKQLSFTWLKLNASRKTAETAAIMKSRGSELRQCESQILSERQFIEYKMTIILSEFKEALAKLN